MIHVQNGTVSRIEKQQHPPVVDQLDAGHIMDGGEDLEQRMNKRDPHQVRKTPVARVAEPQNFMRASESSKDADHHGHRDDQHGDVPSLEAIRNDGWVNSVV